jgi:hypothetical protein
LPSTSENCQKFMFKSNMVKSPSGRRTHWFLGFLFYTLLFTVNTKNCHAQHYDLANWYIVNVRYNLDPKWSLFGEGQLRAVKFFEDYNYYEYKGGFNYLINKNLRFTFGLGKYVTYTEGGNLLMPKTNDEFRVWPQLLMQQSIWKLRIEQRYRYDMRFTSSGYLNRYRYRLAVSYPFGKMEKGFNPFVLGVSNELLFIDKKPYFDRNRLMFSFGYQMSRASMLQIGYLYQYDNKLSSEVIREYLQICLYIELFRNPEKHPTIDHSQKGD